MKSNTFTRLIAEERHKRKLSQEAVCKLICVCDAAVISKWENGVVIPSEDMVMRLIELYENPLIGYIYLRECTQIGKMLLPDVVTADLDNLTLRFQKEYNDILKIQTDMIEIACDNVVQEDEVERWREVQKEIAELASVSLPLLLQSFMKNKRPLQGGNLTRAYV